MLYEWSKQRNRLPLGALPYLVGSVFPLLGVAVPFWLYLRSVDSKVRACTNLCLSRNGFCCVGCASFFPSVPCFERRRGVPCRQVDEIDDIIRVLDYVGYVARHFCLARLFASRIVLDRSLPRRLSCPRRSPCAVLYSVPGGAGACGLEATGYLRARGIGR